MVMELLKGEPFSAYRVRTGALRLHQVAEILLPAARALLAAHDKGIVHRDLKPDNVFLATTPDGRRITKVLDFGIAKVLDPARISSDTQGQQTNTGSILGTPHYMSFEQAMSDKTVDHRTDIWAMGVMIFEALTGRRPLTYDTLGQMYATFLQGAVPSIREFVTDLPPDMADILDRCLAKERAGRLDSFGPLIQILEKYADPRVPGANAGGVVVETPVRTPGEITAAALSASVAGAVPPRRSRLPLAIAAVTVVAVGVGAGAFALTRPGPATGDKPDIVPPTHSTTTPGTTTPASTTPDPPPAASPPVVTAPPTTTPAGSHVSQSGVAPATTHHPSSGDTSGVHVAVPATASTKQGIYERPPY
jgi:serine/threonine-protein kinase